MVVTKLNAMLTLSNYFKKSLNNKKKPSIMQHNNLKKIQRSLMDYYKQVLHLSLEKFSQPDLTKIGMYNLTCEIVRYTYIYM